MNKCNLKGIAQTFSRHSQRPQAAEENFAQKFLATLGSASNRLLRAIMPSTLTITQQHLRPALAAAHEHIWQIELAVFTAGKLDEILKQELEETYELLHNFYTHNPDLFDPVKNPHYEKEQISICRLLARISVILNKNRKTQENEAENTEDVEVVEEPIFVPAISITSSTLQRTTQDDNTDNKQLATYAQHEVAYNISDDDNQCMLPTEMHCLHSRVFNPEAEDLIGYLADPSNSYWADLPPMPKDNHRQDNNSTVTPFGLYLINYFRDTNISAKTRNIRLGTMNIQEIRYLPADECANIQNKFQRATGITLLQFLNIIYSDEDVNPQIRRSSSATSNNSNSTSSTTDTESSDEQYPVIEKIRGMTSPISPRRSLTRHRNSIVKRNNTQSQLGQKWQIEDTVVTSKTVGTKTHASDVRKIANTPHDDHVGINHNEKRLCVQNQNDSTTYLTDTFGSYQPTEDEANRTLWRKDAKKLVSGIIERRTESIADLASGASTKTLNFDDCLETSPVSNNTTNTHLSSLPVILIDFKPLKPFAIPGNHDIDIFNNHTRLMRETIDELNGDAEENNKRQITYVPVFANSYGSSLGASEIESNNQLFTVVSQRIKELRKNLHNPNQNQQQALQVANELLELTKPKENGKPSDNFKSRSKCIKMFAMLRIIAAQFPEHFVICGGCMSAKDRKQSLMFATDLIISLYHAHGNNLDFLDDNGRFIAERLSEDDIWFLRAQMNNLVACNFLSVQGIGVPNNKNLDLICELFKAIPYYGSRYHYLRELAEEHFTKDAVLYHTSS